MSKEAKILIAILVVVVGGMIGLFMLANQGSNEPTAVGDKTKVIRDNSHKKGSGTVQLVEFGDDQCPACSSANANVQQIAANYSDKVTIYFRHFPLEQHKNAKVAAEAAEAANAQGKFWEMHNKLYETQKEWSDLGDPKDKFAGYAKDLGLDVDKFKQAVINEEFKAFIEQDAADGAALNISATPSFFINGTPYTGNFDYASLRDAIEAQLKK